MDAIAAVTRRRKRAAERGEPVTIYFEKHLAERLRRVGGKLGVGLAPIVQEAVARILDEIEHSAGKDQEPQQ